MLNTKKYFQNLEAIPAVKELDNQTAAAIQGGYDLEVYRHINLQDKLGSFNFGTKQLSSNANNQISSFRLNAGRWRFYNWGNWNSWGGYFEWDKKGDWNVNPKYNDWISSIQRY